MTQYAPGVIKSFETTTDLSAKQFYCLKSSADGRVALASAATDKLVGTQLGEAKANESASVIVSGTAKAIAGGTVARGDFLTTDSAGKAIATTTTGNYVIGMALEAADANDIFEYQVGIWKHY